MIMWFFWVLLAVPIAVIITLLLQDKEQLNQKEEKLYSISDAISKSARKIVNKIPSKNNKKNETK